MKRNLWMLAAILAGGIVVAGCGKKPQAKAEVLDPAYYGVGKTAKICPVSKEKIGGEMGPGAELTLSNGKKMMFCCPACKKAVEKDLDKYAAFMY